MRRMMIVFGIAASGALLVSGCQFGGSGDDNGSKPTAKEGKGQVARTAVAPQASTGPAVSKSITMPIAGKQGQTFTLGFAGLKVKGQLATLTLVFTPHGIGDDTDNIFDMCGGSGGDVSMIDTVNLKRYVVVKDSGNNELGPNVIGARVANDQPDTVTYTFAAPQEPNAAPDIYLDNRKVLESVPVTR